MSFGILDLTNLILKGIRKELHSRSNVGWQHVDDDTYNEIQDKLRDIISHVLTYGMFTMTKVEIESFQKLVEENALLKQEINRLTTAAIPNGSNMRTRKPTPEPSIFQQLLRWVMPWRYPDVYKLLPGQEFSLVDNPERFIVTENADYLYCNVVSNGATFGEPRKFSHVRIRWYVRR